MSEIGLRLNKKDLRRLIIGTKPELDIDTCVRLTKLGLMRFTGNQWNEDWDFNPSELEKMGEGDLLDLYLSIS